MQPGHTRGQDEMHRVFEAVAALAAFVSAGLWLWAARIRAVPDQTLNGPSPAFFRAYNRQSQLNAMAATATAVSALLQALALIAG